MSAFLWASAVGLLAGVLIGGIFPRRGELIALNALMTGALLACFGLYIKVGVLPDISCWEFSREELWLGTLSLTKLAESALFPFGLACVLRAAPKEKAPL